MVVVFLLKLCPSDQNRKDVLEILRYVKGPTMAKSGCMACDIFEGAEGLGCKPSVLYLERWGDMGGLQRHIQSSLFAKILAVMEMSTIQPEIQYLEIHRTHGLELLERLRNQQTNNPSS